MPLSSALNLPPELKFDLFLLQIITILLTPENEESSELETKTHLKSRMCHLQLQTQLGKSESKEEDSPVFVLACTSPTVKVSPYSELPSSFTTNQLLL